MKNVEVVHQLVTKANGERSPAMRSTLLDIRETLLAANPTRDELETFYVLIVAVIEDDKSVISTAPLLSGWGFCNLVEKTIDKPATTEA